MKRPRVVVADDYDDTRELLGSQFEGAGFEADFVEGGEELAALVVAEDFDLVITDLAMSPIPGWEAIERIRAEQPDVPVWVVSAHSSKDEMNAARARELNVLLLEKPEGLDTLRERIEAFFNL